MIRYSSISLTMEKFTIIIWCILFCYQLFILICKSHICEWKAKILAAHIVFCNGYLFDTTKYLNLSGSKYSGCKEHVRAESPFFQLFQIEMVKTHRHGTEDLQIWTCRNVTQHIQTYILEAIHCIQIIQLAQGLSSDLQRPTTQHQSSLSVHRPGHQPLWPSEAAPSWAQGHHLSPTDQTAPWENRNHNWRSNQIPFFFFSQR